MRISRFGVPSRVLHWFHALAFIWLLLTGIQLFLTSSSLLGNPLIVAVHLYASLLFIILPVLIITASPGARNDAKELISWNADDIRWFADFLERRKTSVTGKFNGGQKANLMATLLLSAGLSLSGLVVWMKPAFSVGFVELNFRIHDVLAILAVLLLANHIIFALYYSESLKGIIFGTVDEKWAEEHYPGWSEQKDGIKRDIILSFQ